MKAKQLLVSLLVIFNATYALAQQPNWLERFLNEYRAPQFDPAATLVPPMNTENLRGLARDGALPLTIDDLIRLMLASSVDITTYRFNPQLNQYIIGTLLVPFQPMLQIQTSVSRTTTPSTTQLNGAASLSQLSHSYSVGYSQVLSSGTTYGVNIGMNRNSSNSVFNLFNPSYSGRVVYSISQQLLQNRGSDINLKPVRIAKNNKGMSDIQFEQQVMDLVTNAQNMYWDLVFSQENLKVAVRSLELAERTVHDNQLQVKAGTLAPIEVVVAEQEAAAREVQRIAVSYTSDQIQDQVKRLVTNAGDPGIVLTKLNPIQPVPPPTAGDLMPIEDAIRYALETRPELRLLDLELKNHDIDIQYTKNQLLPTLTAFGNFVQYGVGGVQRQLGSLGSSQALIVSRGGLGDAFGRLFGYDYRGYTAGFSLQVPLGNKPAQADYARAVTDRKGAETRKSLLAQQIAIQVRNADSQVQMNRAQITAAEKSRELAIRTLDAEEKKFQLGAANSGIRFILDAQRSLTTAETNELQARINYTKALITYDRAVGRTLKKNNIEIDNERTVASVAQPLRSSANAR
jgi:outer membrane protein